MNTLAAKIAQASVDVGAFVKDKRNKEQGYGYISADAVLARAGDVLAKLGVAVFPGAVSYEIKITPRPVPQGNEPKSDRIDVVVQFLMVVSDGETQVSCPWVGAGSDYATVDKALYKAETSGHKYFLMKLLNIGAGNEDGEHDEEERAQRPAAGARAAAPAQPARASAPVHSAQSAIENADQATGEIRQPVSLLDPRSSQLVKEAATFWNCTMAQADAAIVKGLGSKPKPMTHQEFSIWLQSPNGKKAPASAAQSVN